jgi:hypothetical protein
MEERRTGQLLLVTSKQGLGRRKGVVILWQRNAVSFCELKEEGGGQCALEMDVMFTFGQTAQKIVKRTQTHGKSMSGKEKRICLLRHSGPATYALLHGSYVGLYLLIVRGGGWSREVGRHQPCSRLRVGAVVPPPRPPPTKARCGQDSVGCSSNFDPTTQQSM